jgi:Na+-driven multidrug efflux pump
LAGILWLFDAQVFAAFTNNVEVRMLCHSLIFTFFVLQVPKAINTSYAGNLREAADLNWLMWLAIGAVVINEIIGAYILTFLLGMQLVGLWTIQIVDESGRLVLNYWRFNKCEWKQIT